jgi:hypothetical protein
MSVRMKLDQCGIKLSLRQWSRLSPDARAQLLTAAGSEGQDAATYRRTLEAMMQRQPGPLNALEIELSPAWEDSSHVPVQVVDFASQSGIRPPTAEELASLTRLQRFALLKLSRPGHDNVNFVPAMQQFGLLS